LGVGKTLVREMATKRVCEDRHELTTCEWGTLDNAFGLLG